jgi:hypothetical protein
MARKRAYKKRADYRMGGRVNLEGGGLPDDDEDTNRRGKGPIGKMLGAISNAVKYGGQTNQMWDGRAPVSTSTPTYNPNYANTFNTLNPVAGGQSSSGTVYNPAAADLGRTGAFDIGSTGVAGGTAVTGGAGSGQGASTDATQKPVTPAYTQADVDQAVADLNAGKITAADLAAQYGVSVDYVNQNLAAINTASGYTAPAAAAAPASNILPPFTGGDPTADPTPAPSPSPAPAPAPAPATTTTIPPAISAIPADGRYTPAETQQVVDALNAGTITSAQAADQFGSTVAQVEAELARQNQQAAGQTVTTPDPFIGGVQAATRPKLLDKAQQAQMAAVDVATKADGTTAPGAFVQDYQSVAHER